MPALLPPPALAPYDGRPSSASGQAADGFYTNEEISILHQIVAAAQESLDTLPERERLPTNALFKAYDAILPSYGLNPDDDHHISRLVFRVGGERGPANLVDKLHAVLSRMGIEIVYTDLTASVADVDGDANIYAHTHTYTDISQSPSPPSLADVRPLGLLRSSPQIDDEHRRLVDQFDALRLSGARNPTADERASLDSGLLYKFRTAAGVELHNDSLAIAPSPSLEGETDHSRHSPRSAQGSEFHHGASDTTVQSIDGDVYRRIGKQEHEWVQPTGVRAQQRQSIPFLPASAPTQDRPPSVAHESLHQRQLITAAESHATIGHHEMPLQLPGDLTEELLEEASRRNLELERRGRIMARAMLLHSRYRLVDFWGRQADALAARDALARRHLVRSRHFDAWLSLTGTARQALEDNLRQPALTVWECKLAHLNSKRGEASIWLDRKMRNLVLRSWIGEPTCPDLSRTLQVQRKRDLIIDILASWTEASLHPGYLHPRASRHLEQYQLRQTIGFWQLSCAEKSFRWTRVSRLVGHHIRLLDSQIMEQQSFDDSTARAASRNLAATMMSMWRATLQRQWPLDETAAKYGRRQSIKLKNKAIDTWNLALAGEHDAGLFSLRATYFLTASNTLSMWETQCRIDRRDLKKGAYRRSKRATKAAVAGNVMDHWVTAIVHDQEVVDHRAVLGARAATVRLRHRVLDSLERSLRNEEAMQELCYNSALGNLVGAWSEQVIVDEEARMEAADWHVGSVVANVLGWWDMRLIHHKGDQFMAMELQKHRQRQVILSLLRRWSTDQDQATGMRQSTDGFRRNTLGADGAQAGNALRRSVLIRRSTRSSALLTPNFARIRTAPLQTATQSTLTQSVAHSGFYHSTRSDIPTQFVPDFEEEETRERRDRRHMLPFDAEVAGEVTQTPTRSTGVRFSEALGPTTTPSAPLATPYERELRAQYGSAGTLSRRLRGVGHATTPSTEARSERDGQKRW